MKKFLTIAPIVIGIGLTYLLWKSLLSVALLYLVFLFGYLRRKSFRQGAPYIAAGLVLGLAIEIIGVPYSHNQSITNPDFFGAPLWLPVAVIYMLLLMRKGAGLFMDNK